jgi:hypothetical protein
VTYQYALQLITYTGTHQEKAAELEEAMHPLLQTDLLLCDYYSTARVNPEIIRLDTHAPDTVASNSPCDGGDNCFLVNADLTIDLFYYENSTTRQRRRRNQQSTTATPPMQTTISDNDLMTRLAESLRSTLFELNAADTTASFNFLGLTNAAVTDTLGDGDQPPSTNGEGNDVAGATDGNTTQRSTDKGAVATGFLVIGVAAIVLIAVSVMAVKRYKRNRVLKSFLLEEDYDDHRHGSYDDDQEKASNPTTTPDDILADLHSLHESSIGNDDQEEASTSSSPYSTQSHEVYVLSETNVSYAASMATSPDRQPADTDSLKEAMKDLNQERPPVGTSRGYVASDTVHL